jgi:hypothetical protein
MKINRPDPAYFENIDEDPVTLFPFDETLLKQSNAFLEVLNLKLHQIGINAEPHGSLPLRIGGKNEWEYAIYSSDNTWQKDREALIELFGKIRYEEGEMIIFSWKLETGQKVELVMMRGFVAHKTRAVTKYWQDNPEAVLEYERMKHEHIRSKREYYWWKANYITDILENL